VAQAAQHAACHAACDAAATSDAAADADADFAKLTSRKLLRAFKALMFLALLATAGVGAGVAYKLGARHLRAASKRLIWPLAHAC
jgi:hypothetical protein